MRGRLPFLIDQSFVLLLYCDISYFPWLDDQVLMNQAHLIYLLIPLPSYHIRLLIHYIVLQHYLHHLLQ